MNFLLPADGVEILQDKIITALEKVGFFLY